MTQKVFHLCLLGEVLFVFNAPASMFYVDVNSTNPVPPYAGWSTASTDIQSAIDAAADGDQIWVNDGVYQTGGRVVYGLTNRVVINKAVTVQSVNGPGATVIQGYQIPQNSTAYNNNVRCVFMTNNTTLNGFTITGGAAGQNATSVSALYGGGVNCWSTNSILTNCILENNLDGITGDGGGGVYQGTLNNCILSNNLAIGQGSFDAEGGAAYQSVLNNCLIISNTAGIGGGAAKSTLNHCTVIGNIASSQYNGNSPPWGGGIYACTANFCLIAGNYCGHLGFGGGVNGGTLNGCILSNNVVDGSGGGSANVNFIETLNNCLVISNTALGNGGGVYGAPSFVVSVYDSTITGNTATNQGGGVYRGSYYNCIIYSNICSSTYPIAYNYSGASLVYCCTTPLSSGTGNITNDPVLMNLLGSDFHLQSNSPCINAGKNSYVTTTNDFDGNPRIVGGTVDIGAYEYQTPASVLSYAWAQQYGLPTDSSADYLDSDGDGMNNWQEWKAGTNPTNAASVLQLSSPSNNVSGVTVTWQSVGGVTYYLQSSTNLPAFTSIQSNIVGKAGTTSYTDATATNGGPYFYRVGVQ